jgi:hypothetical protein
VGFFEPSDDEVYFYEGEPIGGTGLFGGEPVWGCCAVLIALPVIAMLGILALAGIGLMLENPATSIVGIVLFAAVVAAVVAVVRSSPNKYSR